MVSPDFSDSKEHMKAHVTSMFCVLRYNIKIRQLEGENLREDEGASAGKGDGLGRIS